MESLAGGKGVIVLAAPPCGIRISRTFARRPLRRSEDRRQLGFLPDGGNAVGTAPAARCRTAAGGRLDPHRPDLGRMLGPPLAACLLVGGIEPAKDIGLPGAEHRSPPAAGSSRSRPMRMPR